MTSLAASPSWSFPSSSSTLIELREDLQEVGGGRGIFAKTAVRAGQLLLVEGPLVTVPHDKAPQEALHVSLARAVLQSPPEERARLLALIAPLHPITLGDLPPEGLSKARLHYAPEVNRILGLLASHMGGNEQPSTPSPDNVLRLILQVQCNAFYSGLYLLCSMLNHACNPSCIKLARPDGTSEVRALRDLNPGVECTISYLAPPLQSFARRVHHLEEQHYFTLPGPSTFPPEMESTTTSTATTTTTTIATSTVVTEKGPAGTPSEMESTAAIATTTTPLVEALEDELDVAERRLATLEGGARGSAGAPSSSSSPSSLAMAGDLLEDLSRLKIQAGTDLHLHPRHVVLARLHSATAATCRLILGGGDEEQGKEAGACSPGGQGYQQQGTRGGEGRVEVALRLLRAALELLETTDLYGGLEHYQAIVALQDLYLTTEWLLSNAPRQLFAAFPPSPPPPTPPPQSSGGPPPTAYSASATEVGADAPAVKESGLGGVSANLPNQRQHGIFGSFPKASKSAALFKKRFNAIKALYNSNGSSGIGSGGGDGQHK